MGLLLQAAEARSRVLGRSFGTACFEKIVGERGDGTSEVSSRVFKMRNWQRLGNWITCRQLQLFFAFLNPAPAVSSKIAERCSSLLLCWFQAFQSSFLLFSLILRAHLKTECLLSYSSPLDKLCSVLWENWPQITGNILKSNKVPVGPSVPLGVFQTLCPPGWILYWWD